MQKLSKSVWGLAYLRDVAMLRWLSRGVFLALALSMLVGGQFVFGPDVVRANPTIADGHKATMVRVQAQDAAVTHLEIFAVSGDGNMYHRWSVDDGASWSAWASLGDPGSNISFTSEPSVVSDAPGHMHVFVMTSGSAQGNAVYYDTFNNGSWTGWRLWQQAAASLPLSVSAKSSSAKKPSDASIPAVYSFTSVPVFTSWGPGRIDGFVNVITDNHGGRALFHTWTDNGNFSFTWESLGTGLMQGTPTATSWGPGRIDVFERGGGNELDHKWFSGSWSSGWENLGGILTSSPTAISPRSGFLDIFVRNTAGGLSELMYGNGFWSGWSTLDSNTISSDIAAASWPPASVHVFSLGSDNDLVHQRDNQVGWLPAWQDLNPPLPFAPAALTWTVVPATSPPPAPTSPPVPTPPPPIRCGRPGLPPCPVEP